MYCMVDYVVSWRARDGTALLVLAMSRQTGGSSVFPDFCPEAGGDDRQEVQLSCRLTVTE